MVSDEVEGKRRNHRESRWKFCPAWPADPGRLRALTIAQCVIVKASAPEVCWLEDFHRPAREIAEWRAARRI